MNKSEMKHVLILDGFPPPHMWLLEKGYRVTWLVPVDMIRLRDGYTRIVGLPTDSNWDEWVNMAVEIHKIDPIDSLMSFSETHQEVTSIIAKKLQLKWHEIETIELINNKHSMRKKLHSVGAHNLKYELVKNERALIELVEKWKVPVILKPIDSYGSEGIHLIRCLEDARKAWEMFEELNYSEGLVEEFIIGEEFSVEAFSEDGKHHIIGITKKFKDTVTFIEKGHYFPAVLNNNEMEEINIYINKILTLLGVKDGVTHTELIITESGPVIIETHLRLAGDRIPDLVKESIGIDMVDVWMDSIVNGIKYMPNKTINQPQKYAAIWFKENNKKGEIKEINNFDIAKNIEGIIKIESMKKIGDLVNITHNSSSRLCFAIAIGDNPEQALNIAKQAIDTIEYTISSKK